MARRTSYGFNSTIDWTTSPAVTWEMLLEDADYSIGDLTNKQLSTLIDLHNRGVNKEEWVKKPRRKSGLQSEVASILARLRAAGRLMFFTI